MNDTNISKFTCKDCGGNKLIITHVWNILAGTDSERWQEWGPLKNNHHWQFQYKEKIGDASEDEVQRGDLGEFQEDDSASEPEEYELHEPALDRENDDFFINCENCDREIAFGWSQPDRRGLVLPVEFSDFNPSESWPDPRYLDLWQQKGWNRQ